MFAKKLRICSVTFCLSLGFSPWVSQARTRTTPSSVVGGEDAMIQEYPHQVALISNPRKPFDSFFCGGSIIAERWILTAAHCVVQEKVKEAIFVASGVSKLTEKGTISAVKRILVHEGYSEDGTSNDIALLELQSSLSFGPKVNAIALAEASTPVRAGVEVDVSGWGSTDAAADDDEKREESATLSEHLQAAQIKIVSTKAASQAYGDDFNSRSMLAAGVPEGGKDSCQGDSGGPLMLFPDDTDEPNAVLVGIVSWGEGCARAGFPGVYTKVAHFSEWIRQKVQS